MIRREGLLRSWGMREFEKRNREKRGPVIVNVVYAPGQITEWPGWPPLEHIPILEPSPFHPHPFK